MPTVNLFSALLGLVLFLMAFFALRACARELTAIRKHLDKLAPEALANLKTARRAKPDEDAPKESYAADPERWLASRRAEKPSV
ncbi:MAG TPA: hypothetical protein DCQ64_23045 [Candidatus Rokubacteria bacterium]|nr:hypothetical protein [Candidatus Rokubacteria bacterium]